MSRTKPKEVNKKFAEWGGFTAEEMAQAALDLGMETDVTCESAEAKAAILKALKGKKGADRVNVLTLDEYKARTDREFRRIAETAVTPETTSFSNPEEDEPEEAPRSRRSKGRERRGEERPPQPEPSGAKTIYVFDIDYGDVKDQQGRREIRRRLIKDGWTIIRKGEK